MLMNDSGAWPKAISDMGGTRYGAPILRFANAWATKMEQMMAEAQPLSQDLSQEAAAATSPPGFSGVGYRQARAILFSSWKYGTKLKAIIAPGFWEPTLTDPE
jgi:hypothetical protein